MVNNEAEVKGLQLISPVFREGSLIPKQYSAKGKNVNPPLAIINAPLGTQSFTLIMHDPDAPTGDFLHWLMWDIPSKTEVIAANSVPVGAIQGLNDTEEVGYFGPQPPAGDANHRYMFELYALDTTLDMPRESTRQEIETAMKGHVLDHAVLTGIFDAGS